MSIKKLFESADKSRNYLAETNEKNAFKDVESVKNVEQIAIKQQTFVPNIDYAYPENFAKFGSAYYYYSGALGRIIDYYPYDGSDFEQNEFYNKSLDVEKYIFNELFPRNNGYANFDSSSYIDLKGGPHGVVYKKAADLFDNPADSKRHSANIYDKNIYESAGLPDSYGTGSRESNLRSNFNSGVTVEFWLKSRYLAAGKNQVIFDMWNNNASGSHDMGRLTIETLSASSGSPFRFTVQSGSMTGMPGSGTLFQQSIGQTVESPTLSDWNHYTFVFQNSGSAFVTKFYLNGYLNHTVINSDLAIGELPSKDMVGRVGALVTRPFRPDGTTIHLPAANEHTLTGSVDEFRFWKAARDPEEVGRNWFTQVRGGTNTDISNTTLGVYYKFNEGVSGIGYLDSNVLDYSGRLTNGTWTGTPSRTLSSAMIEAQAASREYKDPIIYSQHPDVVNLREGLLTSGSFHDKNNTSNLKTLMPSWILEEHETLGNKNPELIMHIMGAYFDKIYNQIEALPKFKQLQYTSASATPIPFAEHLPQSLGLYTPQLFVDADVMSKFLNKTDDFSFEGDLTEAKNLIYLNLYNNLTNIYKTKGTEKAIKNVFRCFNLNDSIIKLKTYLDNNVYTLDSRTPRLKQILTSKKAIFFNTSSHINGTCYQFQDPDDTTGTRGYISGSGVGGYENIYGFTAEVDFTLPTFDIDYDSVDRNFNQVSIFGMYTASTEAPDTLTWPAYDGCNFQVYVVREEKFSKNVFFMLTSSHRPNEPGGATPWENPSVGPIPILTSSIFFDAYDNTDWNLSVRMKPSNFEAPLVSGSDVGYTYDLVFQGYNTKLGTIENMFVLTASVSKGTGHDFLSGSKRMYVGANRKDFTGIVNHATDVRMFNTRYWGKYLDDDSLKQHVYDFENSGISGSFKNISPLDPNNKGYDILNKEMLVLDWNFNDVTSSDAGGNFLTQDLSSGSAQIRRSYGWVGGLSGFKHPGKGHGFKANSTSVSKDFNINTFKFIDPEDPISSDAVQILTADDKMFGFAETVPNFHYNLERSMQAAISDEMLNFFAGVIDFNNVVGEPVNRYRSRYKKLEKLRESFFRRVTNVNTVENYMRYYQWFDDSLSYIISQLMPASGKFSEDIYNVVESHALERNKYKSQFPTIEFRLDDPITPILGINEKLYNWKYNHAPISMSNGTRPEMGIVPGTGGPLTGSELQQVNSRWWRDRSERAGSEISSKNNIIDAQRDTFRETIENDNNQKPNTTVSLTEGIHSGSTYVLRKLAKPYKLTAYRTASPVMPVRGGVNFERSKKIDLTYNSLRPAGPVNTDAGVYVPENVLFSNIFDSSTGKEEDILSLMDTRDPEYDPYFKTKPGDKIHRYAKVQHGRLYEDGIGYKNMKSTFSFPFNIVSSSVNTGYNRLVQFRAMSGVMITNVHNDVYGPDMESPMQGPFTNYAVGGHQSRHVKLNKGSDDWDNRPEAWKILLGKRDDPLVRGAIGMVGPDYPLPNAPAIDGMYPHTASEKAIYYRDFVAKRPVNIRNIRHTTGSTILGNYEHNYQVVQAPGGYSNPRQFLYKQPNLPTTIYDDYFNPGTGSNPSTVRTLLDIHRGATDGVYTTKTASVIVLGEAPHFDFSADYSTDYLQGGLGYATQPLGGQAVTNNSVIISRFSAPGGIEVMSKGYQDYRSSEFSVYNMLNNRNLTVKRPFQSHPLISGSAEENGIRVSDIHHNDYGLTVHAARHTERFFRDSILVPTNQGAISETSASGEMPAFHRVHRNNLPRKRLDSEKFTYTYSGPQLNNETYVAYGDKNFNTTFLATDQNDTFQKIERYLIPAITGAGGPGRSTGNGGSGFTWTGWIKFAEKAFNAEERIWSIGLRQGDTPLLSLDKRYDNGSPQMYNIHLKLDTNNGSAATNEWIWDTHLPPTGAIADTTISDLTSSFVHLALVWGTPKHKDGSGNIHQAQPPPDGELQTAHTGATLYLNGVSQSIRTTNGFDMPRPDYQGGSGTKANFRSKTGLTVSGNTFFSLGGGVADSNDPISASADEYTFWEVALDSGSIQEIYNSGVPCDITASSVYENSGTFLFDWIRFESPTQTSDSNFLQIDASNPQAYNNSGNALRGYNTSSWIPLGVSQNNQKKLTDALQGCQPAITGLTTIKTYTCSNFYDNLNHYHQIPRGDRQYAWMTGAMADTDPCNVRYAGFMPIFGAQAGLWISPTASSIGDTEPWLTMISASDYGAYLNSAQTRYIFGSTKKYASQSNLYGKRGWIPVDFAGLNTIIYEPITSSTNTLGYALNIAFPTASTYRDAGHTPPRRNQPWPASGGVDRTRPLLGRYYSEFIDATAGDSEPAMGTPAVGFNALMLHRNGPYGYGTHAQVRRNPNHPVLRNERSASEISVLTWAEHDVLHETDFGDFPTGEVKRTWDITNFTLPPVSMRGRPALLNYTSIELYDDCGDPLTMPALPESVTLKATDSNERIFFNSHGLNTHADVDEYEILTPMDYLMAAMLPVSEPSTLVDPNYLIFTENVFPSMRMEFVSSSRRRTNYVNEFWRENPVHRVEDWGSRKSVNSLLAFRDTVTSKQLISGSIWPLDAQEDFVTRTGSMTHAGTFINVTMSSEGTGFLTLISNTEGNHHTDYGKAGELQNNYSSFYFSEVAEFDLQRAGQTPLGYGNRTLGINRMLTDGLQYSRKQLFTGGKSMVAPSGLFIDATGSLRDRAYLLKPWIMAADLLANPAIHNPVQPYAGEAYWDAPHQAGILELSKSADGEAYFQFKSYESRPWYDNYQDFRENIRVLAKDYAIVPEFRIHNMIESYATLDPSKVESVYEIPGTGLFSSTSSFFRDYTNSEKLAYFHEVNSKTSMTPSEFRITVSAVKKFNPYKGFYPVQRTMELATLFKKEYGPNIQTNYAFHTGTWEGGKNVYIPATSRIYSTSGRVIYDPTQTYHSRFVESAPIFRPLFAPGILFNSIKSGLAVDYAIVQADSTRPNKRTQSGRQMNRSGSTDCIAGMSMDSSVTVADSSSWTSGPYFNLRLPFETMLKPGQYLLNQQLSDIEPHVSMSSPYTCSLTDDSSLLYPLMASNFFGESANFYLDNGDFTELRSKTVSNQGIVIQSGTFYGMRLKLRRSLDGKRYYHRDFDSEGYRYQIENNGADREQPGGYVQDPALARLSGAWGVHGARRLAYNRQGDGTTFGGQTFPVPQDPWSSEDDVQCHETFTMYSRPLAFGPPILGAYGYSGPNYERTQFSGAIGAFGGFQYSHTPPYYHGESWCDLLFYCSETKKWQLDEIMSNLKVVYSRLDPGVEAYRNADGTLTRPALVHDRETSVGESAIGGGRNAQNDSMQLSASINIFGLQEVGKETYNPYGLLNETENEIKGLRWVIKPKWETPMLNFNKRPHKLIKADPENKFDNITQPLHFGSGTVPRGMWHQFGYIEPDPKRGIFLEIDNIPPEWLQHHYQMVDENSVYNNYDVEFFGKDSSFHAINRKMRSLSDLLGFSAGSNNRKKLGQLKWKTKVNEAVVVVPYVIDDLEEAVVTHPELVDDVNLTSRKKFFVMDNEKVSAAIAANAFTADGSSLDAAGESVRKLIRKMDKYILPPEFDFMRVPGTPAVVMYIFEFGQEFDRDDLSYMWQNLAPRDYKKIEFEEQSIAHVLDRRELLTANDLLKNDIRFMVFKVKQKAIGDYYKHVYDQVAQEYQGFSHFGSNMTAVLVGNAYSQFLGSGVLAGGMNTGPPASMAPGGWSGGGGASEAGQTTADDPPPPGSSTPPNTTVPAYTLQYNWPYDYLSIVEAIKVDVDVLFDDESNVARTVWREGSAVPDEIGPGTLLDDDGSDIPEITASDVPASDGAPELMAGTTFRRMDLSMMPVGMRAFRVTGGD